MSGLSRSDLDPDPFLQFQRWLEAAVEAGIEDANAMGLSTASASGRPSARMVLLKSFDTTGFVFYSNYQSQKGRELDENPHAALLFYWRGLLRQVRIEGTVTRLLAAESDAYFHSRPRESQLGAVVSPQSRVIVGRDRLEQQLAAVAARYHAQTIPRPANWGGYRLLPDLFEFWQDRPNRLHDRFRYTQRPDKSWRIDRLAP